ncbi:unnamed protein product [Caenorhabditis angaria]|uniref:Uncharacterized protein n=1 Tax=Caenorhabditis angaria TaxID=860376 RepID=A0A9P1NAB6_9PELO|nr:unnamed protein product [Caenorhabditis angaria]
MGLFDAIGSVVKSVFTVVVETVTYVPRKIVSAVETVSDYVSDVWHGRKEEYERRSRQLEEDKRKNREELEQLKNYHDKNISSLDSDIRSASNRLEQQKYRNQKALEEHEERMAKLKNDGEEKIRKLQSQKTMELAKMKNSSENERKILEEKYENEIREMIRKNEENRKNQQIECEKILKQQREEKIKIEKEHEEMMQKRLDNIAEFEKTQEEMIKNHSKLVDKSLEELQKMKLELLELQRNYLRDENSKKLEIIHQNVQMHSGYLKNQWSSKLIREFQNEVVISIINANEAMKLFLVHVNELKEDDTNEDALYFAIETFNDWKLKNKHCGVLINQFHKQMNDFQGADAVLKSEMDSILEKYEELRNELGRLPMRIEIAMKKNQISEVLKHSEPLNKYFEIVDEIIVIMQSICLNPVDLKALGM